MISHRPTILVVDDDPQIVRLLINALEDEGYKALGVNEGRAALEFVAETSPDLVLLDLILPGIDGNAVCEQLRAISAVPILMITAYGRHDDKVHGLNMGADDYLTKPFHLEELIARVRANLRRWDFAQHPTRPKAQREKQVGPFVANVATREVYRDGVRLPLTPVEYRLLITLMHHAGHVVTIEHLLERVWGSALGNSRHMVQVNVNRLRHKIEADADHPRYLLTKSGFGYCLAHDAPREMPLRRHEADISRA